MSEETFDLNALEPIFSEFSAQRGALIPVLQRAQELYGYLPAPVLTRISERMHVSLSPFSYTHLTLQTIHSV